MTAQTILKEMLEVKQKIDDIVLYGLEDFDESDALRDFEDERIEDEA